MKNISNETKFYIVDKYTKGFSVSDICKELEINRKSVNKILKDENITKRNNTEVQLLKRGKLNSEENFVIEQYKSGKSINAIEKTLPTLTRKFVINTLKRNNIKIRPRTESCRRLKIDENVFREINEESSYWAGFLMADGNISKEKKGCSRILSLSLNEKDKNHLEKFKTFLKSEHKISNSTKNCVTIKVRSNVICQDLRNYGITENKSLTAKPSKEIKVSEHFWRGVLDGDGCISVQNERNLVMGLVGSLGMVESFSEFLSFSLKITKRKIRKTGNCYRITYTGEDSRKIGKFFYDNSITCLERKKQKIKNVLTLWGIEIN